MTLRRRQPAAASLLGLLALLIIAACDGTPRSEPLTPAGTAAAERNDEENQAGETDLGASEPMLTAEGFGPLRIGMSMADVVTPYGPDSEPEAVGGPEPEVCDEFRPVRAPARLLVMIEAGRLTRISLLPGSTLTTDKGLGVGASAAQVRAAYGPELRSEAHKYEDPPAAYLTAWARGEPAPGRIAGEASRGVRYEIGSGGNVDRIHAGGPSIEYVEGCL